jgi:uncharacterized protein YbjT (DUF2867 family)
MKALIIGATGATGRDLVAILLNDPDYTQVIAFVRRASGLTHAKYSEIITDFDNLEAVSDAIHGDVWFTCLGTTRKAAGSKEKQWHIDHDIPLGFAKLAKKNGVPRAVVVSAYGASATSRVFYSKLKGTLDKAILDLAFGTCVIFRPGFLVRKDTDRPGERVTAAVLRFLNRLGILRRFRPLPTATLAEKLAKAPRIFSSGNHIIELEKIFGI